MDIHEYIKKLEDGGYIDNEGKPLKCKKCEGIEFKSEDQSYCQYGVVEYTYVCKTCGSIEGYWAYGAWLV